MLKSLCQLLIYNVHNHHFLQVSVQSLSLGQDQFVLWHRILPRGVHFLLLSFSCVPFVISITIIAKLL